MVNILTGFFVAVMILHSGYVAAAVDCYEGDVELSKRSSLISGAPYDQLIARDNGVVTLCFQDDEHIGLAFEYFTPQAPGDLSVCMVHYSKLDDCCGVGDRVVQVESVRTTLVNVHRGVRTSVSAGTQVAVTPPYRRYASWILPSRSLLAALGEVQKEAGGSPYRSEIDFARNIMQISGLRDVDFGWWRNTPSNLKILARDYITPKRYTMH